MKRKIHFSLILQPCFIALFILSACQILNPYHGPVTPTPNEWKGVDETLDQAKSREVESEVKADEKSDEIEYEEPCYEDVSRDLGNWWEIFDDPILNQLEEQALKGSYTLWGALEKVIQARETAMIDRSKLFPTINLTPSFYERGYLIQDPLGSSITSLLPPGATPPPSIFRFVQKQMLIPLEISYELDLWYKLNNTYYAALMRTQAASQAFFSVLLSLTADVASNYFLLRGYDTQADVIEQNIKIRQRALEINQARFRAGVINFVDVSRQESEVAQAKSDLDDMRRLRGIQENIIATLIGTPASIFSLEYNILSSPPPIVPKGIPSELLCRRPDIGEAERNLAAAYREIGVAYANFFPSLQLNGGLGVESPLISQLFNWKARFWEWGWNIFQTVFDAGRNQANFLYYESLYRESMANYQQVVLKAFQEVEDELVNLREYAARAEDLRIAIQASQKTLELSQIRYNRGLAFYLDVVDAERDVLRTEQTAAVVLGNRYISTVALIRALGGGWDFPSTECIEFKIE